MINADFECTKKCKNVTHGNLITQSITKRGIDESLLISYISKICQNIENTDDKGRSALHLAASTNKYVLTEWILSQAGINLQKKDSESGHSALHRSIYYGFVNIAVLLKKYGASFEALDNDFVNPLQLCCRQNEDENNLKSAGKETFVWGKNKNYNLGIGNVQSKETPDILDYFRKSNILVKLASINEFHSLLLTEDGVLYSAGHGKGGRLGNGSECTVVVPQKVVIKFVQKNEKIIDISAARSHSLILTDRGVVYSSGINNNFQLGLKSHPENSLFFKEVSNFELLNGRQIYRVVAQDFHSLAIGKSCLFVWGLNVGQFGTSQESIMTLKQLSIPFSEHQNLDLVETSNSAICIYASNKEGSHKFFYIFHNRKLKTFKNPLMEEFVKIAVTGGELLYNSNEISKVIQKQLEVIILTVAKNIYFWYDDLQQFVKCVVATNFNVSIDQMLWSKERLILLIEGHCFFGSIKHKMPYNKNFDSLNEYQETYLKKELSKSVISKMYLKRIPNISTASLIRCDSDGENFIALLENSKRYLNIPKYELVSYDFSELLAESSSMDNIHDCQFVVDQFEYTAHKFIISSRSKYLRKLIETSNGQKKITVNIPNMTKSMFEIILKFIYTNRGPNENDLLKLSSKSGEEVNTLFTRVLLEMDLIDLNAAFKKSLLGFYDAAVSNFQWFDHGRLTQFYDITIKLEDNKEIQAHKAILVSRLEYFKMMFVHSWSENNTIQMKNVKAEYLEPIIKFAYNNNIKTFKSGNFSENYMFNMIMFCDQLLIEDVREIFELMICEKICIRNCGEYLVLGQKYNCPIITRVCMEFICHNLGRALESSTLDSLDPIILNEISQYYRACFNIDKYRNITPDADAISDEDLIKFIEEFETSFASEEGELEIVPVKPKQKVKYSANKSEIERRTYEKKAMSLIGNLSIEEEIPIKVEVKKYFDQSEELVRESWKKVSLDKKDPKKKMILAAIKTNEIMKTEEKLNVDQFVNLKTIVNSPSLESEDESCNSRNIFTLADYEFKQGRSKKGKNRSSSENDPKMELTALATESIVKEIPENPWNLSAISGVSKNLFDDSFPVPNLSFDGSQHSMKSKNFQTLSPAQSCNTKKVPKKSTAQKQENFHSILKDEIKDKQQYEKTKTKSLMFTQKEEEAIEQLKLFYNIDKVFDETIEIGRKDYKTKGKFNYAVWQCK